MSGPNNQGVGLKALLQKERNPAHEDPDWYQRDLDEDLEDPDHPYTDRMPTERHRRVVPKET